MSNYTAHNEETRTELLKAVGVKSVDELFSHLPVKMEELNLSDGKSEMEVTNSFLRHFHKWHRGLSF